MSGSAAAKTTRLTTLHACPEQVVIDDPVVVAAIEVHHRPNVVGAKVDGPPAAPRGPGDGVAKEGPRHGTHAHALQREVARGGVHVHHRDVVVRHVERQVLHRPRGRRVVAVDVAVPGRGVQPVLAKVHGDERGALSWCIGLQPGLHGIAVWTVLVAAWIAWSRSPDCIWLQLGCMGLQPGLHGVAVWVAWGCSAKGDERGALTAQPRAFGHDQRAVDNCATGRDAQ